MPPISFPHLRRTFAPLSYPYAFPRSRVSLHPSPLPLAVVLLLLSSSSSPFRLSHCTAHCLTRTVSTCTVTRHRTHAWTLPAESPNSRLFLLFFRRLLFVSPLPLRSLQEGRGHGKLGVKRRRRTRTTIKRRYSTLLAPGERTRLGAAMSAHAHAPAEKSGYKQRGVRLSRSRSRKFRRDRFERAEEKDPFRAYSPIRRRHSREGHRASQDTRAQQGHLPARASRVLVARIFRSCISSRPSPLTCRLFVGVYVATSRLFSSK